ncbi:MAG: family 16 glycosylhydrolase [Candidatus Oleimicrobiaceae bacterium]
MKWSSLMAGTLVLLLLAPLRAKNYKGAELRTRESYLYGRFEARYRASAGEGHVSTFFTYNDIDPTVAWNEIDIEIHGRYQDDVQVTTITPRQMIHLRHQWVPFNPHVDFHLYAFEWTPEYVAWFIDGKEVYRQTEEHILTLRRPQKIMMNIWNPAYRDWVGSWSDQILPRFAYYDYVSYASYTPGAGDTGTGRNFTHQWTDHFDTWDEQRWEKATHTFPGNNCDFVPENVVFKDGLMILCLTDPVNLGYVDNRPPAVLWARQEGDKILVRFSEEVEEQSAERVSNFLVPGAAVVRASLGQDLRTVTLSTQGLQSSGGTLVVMGVKDRAPLPNTLVGQTVNLIVAAPLALPIRVNVGGEALQDFLPDQEWSERSEYGYADGKRVQELASVPIANTDVPQIYRAQRRGIVRYMVRVPPGRYRVTLLFAETRFQVGGQRRFDVTAEGMTVATDVDIAAQAGAYAAMELVAENVLVEDGVLDVHFAAGRDSTLLCGLVVEEMASSVLPEHGYRRRPLPHCHNHPNPFFSSTVIQYCLPWQGELELGVYDTLGRLVRPLVHGPDPGGTHAITWDGTTAEGYPLPSGVYFLRLQSGAVRVTRRMVLLR